MSKVLLAENGGNRGEKQECLQCLETLEDEGGTWNRIETLGAEL